MATREDNIYFARLAEQGERYNDMIEYMTEVANVSHIIPRQPSFFANYLCNAQSSLKDNTLEQKWHLKKKNETLSWFNLDTIETTEPAEVNCLRNDVIFTLMYMCF